MFNTAYITVHPQRMKKQASFYFFFFSGRTSCSLLNIDNHDKILAVKTHFLKYILNKNLLVHCRRNTEIIVREINITKYVNLLADNIKQICNVFWIFFFFDIQQWLGPLLATVSIQAAFTFLLENV